MGGMPDLVLGQPVPERKAISESVVRVPCWLKSGSEQEDAVAAERKSGHWACQISSKRNGENTSV